MFYVLGIILGLGYFLFTETRKQLSQEAAAVAKARCGPVMGTHEFLIGANGARLERWWKHIYVIRICVGYERHYHRIGRPLFAALLRAHPNGGKINSEKIKGELRRCGVGLTKVHHRHAL